MTSYSRMNYFLITNVDRILHNSFTTNAVDLRRFFCRNDSVAVMEWKPYPAAPCFCLGIDIQRSKFNSNSQITLLELIQRDDISMLS